LSSFLRVILPKYKYRDDFQPGNGDMVSSDIRPEILNSLARVFQRELEFFAERISQLSACREIDVEALYDNIDLSGSGAVLTEKLHRFLLRMPSVFSSSDAEAIADRIC